MKHLLTIASFLSLTAACSPTPSGPEYSFTARRPVPGDRAVVRNSFAEYVEVDSDIGATTSVQVRVLLSSSLEMLPPEPGEEFRLSCEYREDVQTMTISGRGIPSTIHLNRGVELDGTKWISARRPGGELSWYEETDSFVGSDMRESLAIAVQWSESGPAAWDSLASMTHERTFRVGEVVRTDRWGPFEVLRSGDRELRFWLTGFVQDSEDEGLLAAFEVEFETASTDWNVMDNSGFVGSHHWTGRLTVDLDTMWMVSVHLEGSIAPGSTALNPDTGLRVPVSGRVAFDFDVDRGAGSS